MSVTAAVAGTAADVRLVGLAAFEYAELDEPLAELEQMGNRGLETLPC